MQKNVHRSVKTTNTCRLTWSQNPSDKWRRGAGLQVIKQGLEGTVLYFYINTDNHTLDGDFVYKIKLEKRSIERQQDDKI